MIKHKYITNRLVENMKVCMKGKQYGQITNTKVGSPTKISTWASHLVRLFALLTAFNMVKCSHTYRMGESVAYYLSEDMGIKRPNHLYTTPK